jgi:hypothetical protein
MAAATIADMLEHLPTLTRKQVTTLAIAAEPPDGDYTVDLDDAAAAATGLASSAAELRDELLDELEPSDLADALALGTGSLTLTGASYGVAFTVTIGGPEDGTTVTTITAAGVPQPVLERYLATAKKLVANATIWGTLFAEGQALRALHLLARAGQLQRYGVADPGEGGQVASKALGPASTSFAIVALPPEAGNLASTRWGRLYWELWTSVRPSAGGVVLR